MFVMMEPCEALRMAEFQKARGNDCPAPHRIPVAQVILLCGRLPGHAALVLTPAEFDAIYTPDDQLNGPAKQPLPVAPPAAPIAPPAARAVTPRAITPRAVVPAIDDDFEPPARLDGHNV